MAGKMVMVPVLWKGKEIRRKTSAVYHCNVTQPKTKTQRGMCH